MRSRVTSLLPSPPPFLTPHTTTSFSTTRSASPQEDEADASVTYLPFNEGLPDIAICHDDDDAWEKWGTDFAWMVPYYGPAVWTSIWLCKAPRIERSDSVPLVKVGV
jgi:hypothetical protein